ncbi:MAG: methylmalonyl-CoA mutase, partial [Candidatus Eisenbacteria bacterium]|nr:methylmalonyl-CoA mutase [Candidatus Eisenbacteria bacterium]
SILSGAHNTLFTKVMEILNERGLKDILVTGGGIIPDSDMQKLKQLGVGDLFGPGTPTEDIVNYIQTWVKENRWQT